MVEHNLAKVGVASSSLVFRSLKATHQTFFEDRTQCPRGGMVDALVSGASVERRASSILVVGTNRFSKNEIPSIVYIPAEIAQLVEYNLAKVGVASSSLVFRSVKKINGS